jgi:hypothetical protein
MIEIARRATGHIAAWLAWQSMRVTLLPDAEAPRRDADSDT